MSTVKWHEGPIVALDTETTGIDPTRDHIVTAAMVFRFPGSRPSAIQWIIDPQVDIPTEASDVHGWTRDRLDEFLDGHQAARIVNGQVGYLTRDGALAEIAGKVGLAMHHDVPLIVHNAAYDLTLLEHELARHGVDTLTARPAGIRGVIDPMVIEKQFDPHRKQCFKDAGCDPENRVHTCSGCRGGKWSCGGCGIHDRKLESLCRHYRVPHTGAHDAAADALAAVRLAGRLAEAWPEIARWKLTTLHNHQVTWRAEQQRGLADFFRKVGKAEEAASCDGGWPLHSSMAGRAAA